MKAAFLETPGGPEVLHYGDLPTPAPRAGEVLVKVAAARSTRLTFIFAPASWP